MTNEKKTLGILGGMGPMATVHFYELITSHTLAGKDSEHLNIVLTSRASTPDRTDFILGRSTVSPAPSMCEDAKKLEAAGADIIAIPCNTAHYFHSDIAGAVSVPVLNIVLETARHCKNRGFSKVGILATEATVKTGAYDRALAELGIGCVTPDEELQALVTSVIYDYVKAGRDGGDRVFMEIANEMFALGCDALILGCTELPLAAPENDPRLVDSLETLAYASVTACGHTPTGFSDAFMSAYEG